MKSSMRRSFSSTFIAPFIAKARLIEHYSDSSLIIASSLWIALVVLNAAFKYGR